MLRTISKLKGGKGDIMRQNTTRSDMMNENIDNNDNASKG